MNAKKPSESRTESTHLVLPENTNALGTIFGGQIMAWIDIVASICAFRHTHRSCVTASMDKLDFLSPVKLGHIVILQGNVNHVGKTSMEIGVKVTAENPLTGERKQTASAYLTFVALDENDRPTEIPPITPETDQEKRWFAAAIERKKYRLSQLGKK